MSTSRSRSILPLLDAPAKLKARVRVPRPEFPLAAPTQPGGVEVVEEPARTGVDFDTGWARRTPARAGRFALQELLLEPMVAAFAAPKVFGLDRLADIDGPVIFASNHESHADTPVLLRTIPARMRHKTFVGAAADYWFSNRTAGAAAALALNAVPIERNRVSRRSALDAAELVAAGWSMIIFPEGGRSPDGWTRPFRVGAAFLARHSGAPVVPVHLEGTREIMPKGSWFPRRRPVTVTFGAPLHLGDSDTRDLAARIEAAVRSLADETATDWWTARRRAHRSQTPTLSGPDAASWRRSWALDATRRTTDARRWPR